MNPINTCNIRKSSHKADQCDSQQAEHLVFSPKATNGNAQSLGITKRRQPTAAPEQMANKASWSIEETTQVFRVMAEYTYVDQTGLKPLAIYLNPEEVDTIEMCQEAMRLSDAEIVSYLKSTAQAGERMAQGSQHRGTEHLYKVVCHIGQDTGQSVRAVNEKCKNTRSRIINWFTTMFSHGTLPNIRPLRYIVAMMEALRMSAFLLPSGCCDLIDTLLDELTARSAVKHDIDLWLDAMIWLYPRRMHEFLLQTMLSVARKHAEKAQNTDELHVEVLGESPRLSAVIRVVFELACHLKNINSKFDDIKVLGKKRKMEDLLDARIEPVAADVRIGCGEAAVSTDMFHFLKNEDKIKIAGQRVKLIAAVGGVVRNTDMKMADIKYHLYRLWTCVSRFKDIGAMFLDGKGESGSANFSEFVVVHDYLCTFEEASVEPHIRVAQTRIECHGGVDVLVDKWVGSSINETRREIPVWLAVVVKSDGSHALALVICSPLAHDPLSAGMSMLRYRHFTDAELASVVNNAIETKGNVVISGVPMNTCGGLEPWPWSASNATVDMSRGQVTQVIVKPVYGAPLTVSTAYTKSALDPWCEPRVLAVEAYTRQCGYANLNIHGMPPSFACLVGPRRQSQAIQSRSSNPSQSWQEGRASVPVQKSQAGSSFGSNSAAFGGPIARHLGFRPENPSTAPPGHRQANQAHSWNRGPYY
ncbi:hypothetical protein BX070DRAFT_233522 [Coemansia spiralis]|nr:hypothetical protein BX070DRAFT_233522 [Coemansia spiralis]